MPVSENHPKAKATPESAEEQDAAEAAAGASIPPEPDADDPVTGPRDQSWRYPEPAKEPAGYREAQVRERDEAAKANAEMSEASQDASLAKGDDGKK